MTRHVLNSVVNVELDVKMCLKQRRKDRLDVEMPMTTSNDVTKPVVKSVVNGQLGVEQVIDHGKQGQNGSIGGQYVF